jgi:hypothetical protein
MSENIKCLWHRRCPGYHPATQLVSVRMQTHCVQDVRKKSLLLTYLLTPWSRVLLEKLTGYSASQEIPSILWDIKVHYRVHKRPPPVLIPSQLDPIHTPTSWRSILILSLTFQPPYSDQCHSQLPYKFTHLVLLDRHLLSICDQSDYECSHEVRSRCTAGTWDRNHA